MTPPSIPGFRFLAHLGGGPLFQVWEVRPADDVAPFALKCPRPEASDSPTALTLLRREARAGRLVQHPRLLNVVRAHLDGPPYYLLSELLVGETMADRMARGGGRLSPRNASWIVRQTAEALAALHAAGLIHADVKPANVQVAPGGEATLLDLAFAHKAGEDRRLHACGHVSGTANYIAPELCRFPPVEGPSADVFALGVVLFEALTGSLPYASGSLEAAVEARHTETPRTLADVPGRWPDRLPTLVAAMLDTDPGRRPTATRVVWELMRVEMRLLRQRSTRALVPV